MKTPRSLSMIAADIRADWKNVSYDAEPYLEAMETLNSIDDMYYEDSARSVVLYFLCNVSSWKGDVAKDIKLELKSILN